MLGSCDINVETITEHINKITKWCKHNHIMCTNKEKLFTPQPSSARIVFLVK